MVGRHEEFDGEDADVVEFLGEDRADQRRLGAERHINDRRHRRGTQDAAAVDVLHRVIVADFAILGAHHEDRNLALEGHEGLEDGRLVADRCQRPGGTVTLADDHLTLAIIAEASRLQNRRQPDHVDRPDEIIDAVDGGEGRDVDAAITGKGLFDDPVLRNDESLRSGADRQAAGQEVRSAARHVLEFVGDDVDVLGEARECHLVRVVRLGDPPHHVKGGALRLGSIDMAAQAETGSGESQHAAELATPQDADDLVRADRTVRGRHGDAPRWQRSGARDRRRDDRPVPDRSAPGPPRQAGRR
ncbi:MAG: hypothetical protein FD152_2905 [Xanthobacteraceae bacterium]|nr:MAG: hypothetical protein FD152_2905 [Xanthobacteraceae bacterium]